MELEYKIITVLAEEMWKLKKQQELINNQIAQVEVKIGENSFYWCVSDDGLVHLGLGVFHEPIDCHEE